MAAGGLDGASAGQVIGGLAIVLALLLLALRALQRWRPDRGADAAVRLLSVRRLGPRRELQELRVGDAVHTIYRHEAAMVLLQSEPWSDHVARRGAAGQPTPARRRPPLKAWLAAAGGRTLASAPDADIP